MNTSFPAPAASNSGDKPSTVLAWPLGPGTKEVVDYDYRHVVTYVGLLNAEAHGASESDMARALLEHYPSMTLPMARRAVNAHLARAHWLLSIKFKPLMWCLGD